MGSIEKWRVHGKVIKLEDRSTEMIQSEEHREKLLKKISAKPYQSEGQYQKF